MQDAYAIIGSKWFQTFPASKGLFSTTADFSGAAKGPLVVDVFAWDAEPGKPPRVPRDGHPARGMRLEFDEDSLSSDRWYTGSKPDEDQYFMAMFMRMDDPTCNAYDAEGWFSAHPRQIRPQYD